MRTDTKTGKGEDQWRQEEGDLAPRCFLYRYREVILWSFLLPITAVWSQQDPENYFFPGSWSWHNDWKEWITTVNVRAALKNVCKTCKEVLTEEKNPAVVKTRELYNLSENGNGKPLKSSPTFKAAVQHLTLRKSMRGTLNGTFLLRRSCYWTKLNDCVLQGLWLPFPLKQRKAGLTSCLKALCRGKGFFAAIGIGCG